MAYESAGTGVAELDRALGGLYWGDNVVWVWEAAEISSQALFYDAIARRLQLSPGTLRTAMSRAQARHLGEVRRLAPEFFPEQG